MAEITEEQKKAAFLLARDALVNTTDGNYIEFAEDLAQFGVTDRNAAADYIKYLFPQLLLDDPVEENDEAENPGGMDFNFGTALLYYGSTDDTEAMDTPFLHKLRTSKDLSDALNAYNETYRKLKLAERVSDVLEEYDYYDLEDSEAEDAFEEVRSTLENDTEEIVKELLEIIERIK